MMADAYTFGILSKIEPAKNDFFKEVMEGCIDAAAKHGDTCYYDGPPTLDAEIQVEMLRDLYHNDTIDGIAVAVLDEDLFTSTLQELKDSNSRPFLPVITFDSDAPKSARDLTVLTNQTSFGHHLGKALLQLEPVGGKYAIISSNSGPNLAKRVEGAKATMNERFKNREWIELPGSPTDCNENSTLSRIQIEKFVDESDSDKTMIIAVGGWPMWKTEYGTDSWEKTVETTRRKNHTLVSIIADATDEQIYLFRRGYANGLISQEPFQMGQMTLEKLRELVIKRHEEPQVSSSSEKEQEVEVVTNTHILEMLRVPTNLPDVVVDSNSIQKMRPMGYCATGIICCLSVGFAIWTFLYRKNKVVKASQPFFLIMICAGVFIQGLVLVPLSVDDQHPYDVRDCEIACMAVMWLISIGFSITFSALFSKLWRINKIFASSINFKRIQVTVMDVMVPFLSLLAANLIILIIWTLERPSKWERKWHDGSDDWNRPTSSYGSCVNAVPYLYTIVALNGGVLLLAIYQAYKARNIATDFSESKCIGIVVLSMLQILLLAVPTIVLANDKPQVRYLVVVVLAFLLNLLILSFIFIPKVIAVREEQSANSANSFVQFMSEARSGFVMYGMNTSVMMPPSSSPASSSYNRSTRQNDGQISFPLGDSIINEECLQENETTYLEDSTYFDTIQNESDTSNTVTSVKCDAIPDDDNERLIRKKMVSFVDDQILADKEELEDINNSD